jgi:ornithine cyclodeaminase/alanine dehydrogenase
LTQRFTLLLSRAYIHAQVPAAAYLPALREAFLALDRGELRTPSVGHLPGNGGSVHIKAAAGLQRFAKVVVKINANFPGNPMKYGLPTIQGVIVLIDAYSGELLALMDSSEITGRRTAAASALAAQHLALPGATRLGVIGCGLQAVYHLEALREVFALTHLTCMDIDEQRANRFADSARSDGLSVTVVRSAPECARNSEIVLTCTTSTAPILRREDVPAGCFIAAVGTDSATKHEIAPQLMASSHVVVDDLTQAVEMGDTHHAIRASALTPEYIYAELHDIVSGRVRGRTSSDQVFVFDSTGMAIEDLAAADLVFAIASQDEAACRFALNQDSPTLKLL